MPQQKTGSGWFDVDKNGLRKLIAGKDPGFIVFELIQNAWDENGVTRVDLIIESIPGKPLATLRVDDDAPEGFHDLTHAWTLFAESGKKDDPGKRGRFNLGEKLILSLCAEAVITTTTGRVRFLKEGKRIRSGNPKTKEGSVFEAIIRLTHQQVEDAIVATRNLIPPSEIVTTVNGRRLGRPPMLATADATLPTVVANEHGELRRSARKTAIDVYDADGAPGWLYELGIPVVETGDTWHYDVNQKVPVNLDRDNVPPSYLRKLRAAVLNATHDLISEREASETWVREAASHPTCTADAFGSAMDARFGPKRFTWDPSDHEANHQLVADGYTPVHGRQLSEGERANRKTMAAAGNDPIVPAGKIKPTDVVRFSPDGEDKFVPPERWTADQRQVVHYTHAVAKALLHDVQVQILSDITENWSACYSRSRGLTYNVGRLGHRWFAVTSEADLCRIDSLIIHELAHHVCGDHLSSGYHEACCDLGAKLAMVVRCEQLPTTIFFGQL